MKTEFSSDDDRRLKETSELDNMIIVIRSAFHENKNY